MRISPSIFIVLGFAVSLQSATQTIKVSPSALTGWTVTGANQTALTATPNFELPAGAQLSRQFSSQGLAVRVTTQPVIGANSSDWPVLEIGSATLLLSRDELGGRLLVVLGDNDPLKLPITFPLDAEGRSAEPLTVNFSFRNSTVTVEALGKTLSFQADSGGAVHLELVVSAGDSQPWPLDDLEVTDDSSITSPLPAPNISSGKLPGESFAVEAPADAPAEANAVVALGNPVVTAIVPTPPRLIKTADSSANLELFTPSAVRHGRAGTVRVAAEQALKK